MERKQTHGIGSFGTFMKMSILEGTIIAAFFPEVKELTIKEIQKILVNERSYERVNTALKSLSKKCIVKERNVGKTLYYSLDLQSPYAYMGFISYCLEREIEFIKRHKTIYKAIQEIESNRLVWSLVLFGSYSKETETKNSDVDIIVTCVQSNEKEIELFIKSLKHKYGINFAPIVLPIQEFPEIKKDNPELWQDLKMHGIAWKGDDSFYYWMYKDEPHN